MELTQTKFKQTEVGLIPEDWDLVPFDKIFSFYSTSNYSKAQMSEDDEVGCIHYGLIHAITNTKYDLKAGIKYYVTSEQAKYELVCDGDVIMVDASEDLAGVNKSVEVFGVGNKKYISGLHTYLLRDKKSMLADNFRGILLNSQTVKNQMLQLAVGMKVFGVSKTQLINVKLPLPPLPEQKAIAQVLSDTDILIQAIEQKLTKKRAIKQGAMQKLLTPKEDWEVKKLGDIARYRRGSFPQPYGLPQWYDENNGTPFVQVYDVDKNMRLKLTTKQKISDLAKDKSVFVEKGNVVITLQGSIGRIAITQYDAYVDRTLLIFTDYKVPMNKVFFAFVIQEKFRIEKENAPGGIIKTITKEELSKFDIPLPKTKDEQTEIATILSDMDADIEQLEQKLSKYKMLKQGLMQNLLTGKIRLV
ncbi:restriction endonuclease subunit S [Psychroserpens mesophilus]|uniref:restriction endonuclease subunit S n=1 Tax=Psychroserpens mesophilus TaxID=325473 RepID=UPI000693B402|nr:restriction endonuclease subunit S [Psychroserpens mesophilus]